MSRFQLPEDDPGRPELAPIAISCAGYGLVSTRVVMAWLTADGLWMADDWSTADAEHSPAGGGHSDGYSHLCICD